MGCSVALVVVPSPVIHRIMSSREVSEGGESESIVCRATCAATVRMNGYVCYRRATEAMLGAENASDKF